MARKKKRKSAANGSGPPTLSPNQKKVYFILEAANAEGGCVQEEMTEPYMATFGVGLWAVETTVLRRVHDGYITRERIPDTGPLFSHRLMVTELGQWWVIAKDNPELGFILRRRKDILELVKRGCFRISLLEAMDDEIRRILEAGLEKLPAPPTEL